MWKNYLLIVSLFFLTASLLSKEKNIIDGAKSGDALRVKSLLQKNPELVNATDSGLGASEFQRLQGPYLGQTPPSDDPVVFAPSVVSTNDHMEMGCTWMPDGREIYFARSETSDVSSNFAIWVVCEKDGKWSKPEVASFSGIYRDFAPFITPDGKYMLFYRMSSEEAEARKGTWVAEREGDTWSEPHFFVDAYCVTTADFKTFYYSTESREHTSRDIAKMVFSNGVFSKPRDLKGDINSEEFDAHECISADGSFMIYDSMRPGGYDRVDIYVSFRNEDGKWSKGFNLGKKINKGHHHIPSLSADGKHIFFSSDGDIYWVSAKIIEHLKPKELK